MGHNQSVTLLEQIIGKQGAEMSPSPYMQWLNGTLEEVSEGKVVISFDVRKEMCNPAMILHGGVIAGMMDEVVGVAVYSLGRDTFFSSINLNVDFLRPAKLGDTIQVNAQVVRAGKRVIHVSADMTHGDKLIASAHTNLITTGVRLPQFSVEE